MSLFKTKYWWRIECGTSEEFERDSCLLVAPLFGADRGDVIVVGSSDLGVLRIYCPSSQWSDEINAPSGYKPTDLMLETKLEHGIMDLKAGRFIPNSRGLGLAVLMHGSLVVYRVEIAEESSEHGDRCIFEAVYKYENPRFPYSMTIGAFGGADRYDAICVLHLDGQLLAFYDRGVCTFALGLDERQMPACVAYDSRNDILVTLSSDRALECYRYQKLAEASRRTSVTDETRKDTNVEDEVSMGLRLEPDGAYALGIDRVLGIEIVNSSSLEVDIVVLATNSLYCFRDNCAALKYSKRLDYEARCLRAYVIEPDGNLMVLVGSANGTLVLYEGTTLRWSAELPFKPIAIARANFLHLEGAIVVLSDDGRLASCYLGTKPTAYVTPPLHHRGFNYEAAQKALLELRRQTEERMRTAENTSIRAVESELLIVINVSNNLEEASLVAETSIQPDNEGTCNACRVSIELSSYTLLRDVEVDLESARPLHVSKPYHVVSNLSDRQVLQTTIRLVDNRPVLTGEITVTATYVDAEGILRVSQKRATLPLTLFLRVCPPENTANFTATIKSNDKTNVRLGQLFPEFVGENSQRSNSNVLGLQYRHTGSVVTIVAGTSTNGYRIQSNVSLSVTLVLEQLVDRLRSRNPGSYVATIGQSHLQLVQTQIEAHFATRQRVKRITYEIELLTTQLGNIERRFMSDLMFGERNSRSVGATGLPILLKSTYRSIDAHLEDLKAARTEREIAGHDLQCALRLLLLLLRLNANDNDKYAMLESAIGFEPQPRDDIDWEELANVALGAMLYFTSRKSENSGATSVKPILNLSNVETARDVAKLKKRVVHAVERVNRTSDVAEVD